MKILRRSLGIALAGLLLILMTPASATAQVVPQIPASYWGTVKIRNAVREADAPAGTVVTAWVEGVERGRIVTTVAGKYGGPAPDLNLYVQGDIAQGAQVVFYVNGVKADQTASFQNDHPKEKNLRVPVLVGDANGDGDVNVLDMTKIARIILGFD